MSQDRDPADLLADRLMVVGEISAVNAEALKVNQRIGGLQMDRQRLSEDGMQGAGAAGKAEREQIEGELSEAEAALAACMRRIEALEEQMEMIDRRLAQSAPTTRS